MAKENFLQKHHKCQCVHAFVFKYLWLQHFNPWPKKSKGTIYTSTRCSQQFYRLRTKFESRWCRGFHLTGQNDRVNISNKKISVILTFNPMTPKLKGIIYNLQVTIIPSLSTCCQSQNMFPFSGKRGHLMDTLLFWSLALNWFNCIVGNLINRHDLQVTCKTFSCTCLRRQMVFILWTEETEQKVKTTYQKMYRLQ